MTKILLTAHILDQLLRPNSSHSVVTTVRSEEKAAPIRNAYKDRSDRLQVVVVGDISKEGAFDEVVKTPGLEVVMHTASPFHYKWTDPQKELVDPAVIGTTSILKAIHRSAPTVKRVIVTSSFASVLDVAHLSNASHTFTEASWNPNTIEDLHESPITAYRVSKTLAERAAWDFVRQHSPTFDLATICPPVVLGPVLHHLASLESINTSNERIVALVSGKCKEGIPDTGLITVWVDVRDTALAHVRAMEVEEAGGKRHLTIGGRFKNRDIADVAWKRFPDLKGLPDKTVKGGEAPSENENFKYNNDETTNRLGIKWRSLDDSVTDAIKSLREHGI
ncbi:methylglyoxal reductase (NADPH-dependent) gre2 [Conoideocrella luteorostrata]|uniref:Methylglyoxal reductase (NADPH-dependent) gre2 n=1 Tax=Conoideocrella luteorostrata TaxID=1105319 RepID=A0AAJ0FVI7_9HYPO|nr:methylglyoxal reductase (NADPH-dependent) gre2 [Conoideocrella luteorostrata]